MRVGHDGQVKLPCLEAVYPKMPVWGPEVRSGVRMGGEGSCLLYFPKIATVGRDDLSSRPTEKLATSGGGTHHESPSLPPLSCAPWIGKERGNGTKVQMKGEIKRWHS